jgi:hypothetical protein
MARVALISLLRTTLRVACIVVSTQLPVVSGPNNIIFDIVRASTSTCTVRVMRVSRRRGVISNYKNNNMSTYGRGKKNHDHDESRDALESLVLM